MEDNQPLDYETFVNSFLEDEEKEAPVVEEGATKDSQVEAKSDEEDEDYLYLLDEDEEDTADDAPSEDDSETDEDVEEDEEATKYSVTVDGEELEVSLDELKKGYGLQKSLTQKGQELAEQRKKLDAEAEAVAWAKQQPEARDLMSQIQEASEAVQRGFVFDDDGNQVRLTQAQIERTKQNIAQAQSKLGEMSQPPRLADLQEAIPEMFGDKAAEAVKPYAEMLEEFGYSQPEINAVNDPRTFLMMKELRDLRELKQKVDNAKAKRSEKGGIVQRPTKAKGSNPVTSKRKSQGKKTDADIAAAVRRGDQGVSYADIFDDFA